ncbi:hypothetical protein TNCV_4362211 [Trichonephila clavipes]|nr:hypothetical protein TNCV_4362211 [Trichonephila clavipes]
MITSIADVSRTLIGPPLLKSRPPLQAQVSKTMNIRVPDRVVEEAKSSCSGTCVLSCRVVSLSQDFTKNSSCREADAG